MGIEYLPADRKIVIDRQLIVGEESRVAIGYPRSIKELYFQQLVKLSPTKRMLADQLAVRINAEGLTEDEWAERLDGLYQLDTIDGRIIRDVTPSRVGNVHSHTFPTPISYTDLVTFLSTAELRVMVVGRSDGYFEFVAKTDETVPVNKESVEEISDRWSRMMSERVERGIRQDGIAHMEANQRAQTALARSIVNKYKVGYYVGANVGLLERVK